ncbi:MAG: xanthine dehydrogenase family protein molybdopterin-binding subunit [Anaerolineaceae bacterium]|nr:xanthine dehydrogenase family protein molybdopterin-binding subunit [Anaerolineaceae bacterium]
MSIQAKPLPKVELPPLRQIGQPLRRIDAMEKCVGVTRYSADYAMTNMLHAKVLRSSKPHARITKLDISKALAYPGVEAVLTSDDMPNQTLVTDMPGQTGQQRRAGSDAPVLAKEIVRFYGEAIALVAAQSLDIAERAVKLIEVEYEELVGVFDTEEAMKPGAPIVFAPDNIVAEHKVKRGDMEKGFAEADLIVEREYRMPYIDHAYLEPESGVAWVDDQGVVHIRVCTQVVEHYRSIALALGLSQNKVHIEGTLLGGGFGGKEDITVEIYIGLLAMKTKKPVRLEYTREESLKAHSKRHPFIIRHKTGVKKNGKITASQVRLISNSGAYVFLSPYVLMYATSSAVGPYYVENVDLHGYSVATNNPFSSAFRGFGAAQACVAYEQHMDEIAKEIGMDRLELRKVNYIQTGQTTATGAEITSAAWLEETVTHSLAKLGEKSKPSADHIKIGHGFASYMQSYGRIMFFHDTSQAWVTLEQDGGVTIRCGVPDLGAGQISALCQIAAEVLGVSMLEDVVIYYTDSALTPLAGTSTATRQLYMSGNAVLMAATSVRTNVLTFAAEKFDVTLDDMDIAERKAFVKTDPTKFIALDDLAKQSAAAGVELSNLSMFKAPFCERPDPETGQGEIWPDFTFGAMAVEVAVDMETGEVSVLKSVACHDIGRAINPVAVEGQIQGGGMQGLGYGLMEDLIVDQGYLKTHSFAEYLIPTAYDMPAIQTIILESGTGKGPFGAKGIGEPSLTPGAPALANAVADAIAARVTQLPLTPERVLAAIKQKKEFV